MSNIMSSFITIERERGGGGGGGGEGGGFPRQKVPGGF